MSRNFLIKKGFTLIIIILFIETCIISSTNTIVKGYNSIDSGSNSECYGFVIPLPSCEDITEKPDVQYSVMNLVNDLFRINAPVYWSSYDMTFMSKEMLEGSISETKVFEPGTFIVPFTGDPLLDTQITVVMYDYNASHELHEKINPPVEIMMLLQPLDISDAYELTEPRIAYYFGEGITTRALNWYVSSLYEAGFLTNEFLDDGEVINKLNNHDFNVFIWSGGSIIDDLTGDINILSRMLKQYRIKQFVVNGGGFIGSCYGAFAASSGLRIFPFTFLKYYFPRIPSLYFLSIQDCLLALAIPAVINITIQDIDHPVVYGVNGTINGSSLEGGPVFTRLGKHTKSLATVKEVNLSWLSWVSVEDYSFPKKIIERWIEFTEGKTIWAASQFKKGKVVTFGDHPESGNAKLNRVIHNSLLYVTSHSSENSYSDKSYPVGDIETKGGNSVNLTLYDNSSQLFDDVFDKMNYTLEFFNNFTDKYDNLSFLIEDLINQNNMSLGFSYQMRAEGLWQVDESIRRVQKYLDKPLSEEDAKEYLEKLESVYNLLLPKNVSIIDQINRLKEDLLERLYLINETITSLPDDLYDLEYELRHYENTDDQDELILKLCGNLKRNSRTIDKYCPGINFETLKLLRESWYTYESLEVTME